MVREAIPHLYTRGPSHTSDVVAVQVLEQKAALGKLRKAGPRPGGKAAAAWSQSCDSLLQIYRSRTWLLVDFLASLLSCAQKASWASSLILNSETCCCPAAGPSKKHIQVPAAAATVHTALFGVLTSGFATCWPCTLGKPSPSWASAPASVEELVPISK